MVIFFYNTPIYKEILLQFLQFTETYYVNRTAFHFRRCAKAVLRRAARLSKAFSTARHSTPKNGFIRRSEPCRSSTPQHSTASKIGLSHLFEQILYRKRVKPKTYTVVVISALNLNFYIPYLQHFDRFLLFLNHLVKQILQRKRIKLLNFQNVDKGSENNIF